MLGEWRVQILHTPGRAQYRLFLYQNMRSETVFLTKDGLKAFSEGASYQDADVFLTEMDDDQLIAFAQALADKGIKTNKDSIAEGKLAATEKHLEDMRSLVFKGKK